MKTINSFRSKLLALTFALMASVSTFAYEFEYVNDFHVDGFAYKVLPPTMEAPFGNVALIEIADCTEDVVIPGTVTHEGVTYIVTTLGGGATLFTNSAKEIVKSVFIPKKISTINSPLFADCSNLTSIVVDSRNSYYDSRENCNAIITTSQNSFFTPNMLIAGCKTTTIPNSVTEIADKAFYRSAIESITIPTGVTKIGHSAFNQATLLSSIKLPITLTEIGDWAFADCLNLNTISCYALEPPMISSNTFFGSNPIYNNPSVYVHAYCIEAYKNAEHWKWFTQILPINEPAYKDRWCDTWNVLTIKRELETWQYNLAYDTIIGDYTYTAVTRHTTKVPAGVYPVMAPEPEYVAAVRFTEDKKAFIYYDNTEYLLYDFNAQPGDELTVFAGINHYRSHKTNRCGIGEVNIFPDSNYYYSREISLTVVPNYNHSGPVPTCAGITKWIEGVGDICGLITGADCGLSDDQSALLCAYKDGNTEYTTEYEEYAEYGCEYNSGENKEYILTLPGLQRTEVEFHTDGAGAPSLVSFNEYTPTLVNGKWYLYDGRNYLREENNQVLLYSPEFEIYEDVVLYDWTLEIGDTLPFTIRPFDDDKSRGAVFRVTDVSTITLLDGKEYKKWTLACGIEYIEGIGAINGEGFGNYFCIQHTAHPATYIDTRLVCASRNGQLLYQMDEAEMERLGTECLCEVETSYKSQWCDTWNVMWFDGMRFDETASTSKYRLGKDTVIGDYTYSKFTSRTSVRFTDDKKVYVYYEGFDDNDPYTVDLPTGEYLAYDFSAQVGDTLEVFSGVHSYSKYKCLVHEVQTDPETKLRTITLFQLLLEDTDGDGVEEEYGRGEMTWIEGVGSPNGFLINTTLPGGGLFTLLCAYKDDELKYTGSFYERFGCDYNAGVISDDLFPTLSGLQRTICREYCEQADNKTRIEQFTNLTTRTETGAPYIYYSPFLLREKDNKILIYSRSLNKDLVLYDFNLQVGDSLPMLYIDFFAEDDWIADRDMEIWCVVDYHKDLEGNILPADTLIVTDVSAITLLDGKEYKKWTFNNGMEYVEGIGSFGNGQWSGDFFQLIANRGVPTSLHGEHLVCVSKNNQLLYQMDDTEMERLNTECLCEYNAEQKPEDLFPTLWGLQRTSCTKTIGEDEYGTVWGSRSYLMQEIETVTIDGKQYLLFGTNNIYDEYCSLWLREENNKILLYSTAQKKDLVLYDFTLNVGDSLPRLYVDYDLSSVVDYDNDEWGLSPLVVTEVSTITLLDGKEYKKWTFDNGMQYVEGIGSFGTCYAHNDFYQLIANAPLYSDVHSQHLVCVSKNNKLLYQMDDTEMERLGAECLCEYNSGPKKDNAKNGKIGGRPTPTQWNMLEVETKEMDGTPTIVRAETFSYTLENDSVVTNGKTFYQLARQSTKDTAITKSFVGALHFGEDEDNRVYFLRDGVEYVLYDFTAEPGDTIEIFAGINNYPQETTYTHVVTGKDTLENGACRMMLEVVFPDETTTATNAEKVWLAGLGSIDGIVHNAAKRTSDAHAAPRRSASSETQTSVMLCAWRDDNCLYTTNHPEYDTFGCVYNQDPTAVEDVQTSGDKYQKIIRNGHLYILRDNKLYDVLGTPMN